jgi:hypothetical protein
MADVLGPDEFRDALAVAYIASGAHGISMDLKLSDEEIRTVVARAIRVWREIQRQLKEPPEP